MNTWVKSAFAGLVVVGLCLIFATGLLAVPKFGGSYNITGYKEPTLGGPYTWCFDFTNTGTVLGFPDSGTWNVPSYSLGWSGEWYVDGDEVIMHGVADGTYFFSWKGRIVNDKKIAGRQVEFFSNGTTDTAGTFLGAKITGSCPASSASVSAGNDPARK